MKTLLALLALLAAVPAGVSQTLTLVPRDMGEEVRLLWVTNTPDFTDPATLMLVRAANGIDGSKSALTELALRRYVVAEPNLADPLWRDDPRPLVGLYKKSLVVWGINFWEGDHLYISLSVSPEVGERHLPLPVLLSVQQLTDGKMVAGDECDCPVLRLVVRFEDDVPGVCRHEGPNPASIILIGECHWPACAYNTLEFDAADLAGGRP